MIKQLLQGRPLGHPLHPIIVHLPIGMFYLSFLLDLWSLIHAGNSLVRGSFYLLSLGVACALLAALPGFADYTSIRRDSDAKKIATRHMILNLIAVVLYAVSVLLRRGALDEASVSILPFALSLVGVAIISYSGYLGGVLVYDEGVAVGRHRRSTPLPDETIQRTSDPSGDGFVEIADASALAERQTIRAEVDGFILAVAKVDGELRAFQEFCTHRFGPLSQGCFKDGKVMCPWHRSQFDVRSGKVAAGPAKVDLKTFEVTTRDGKIFVRART
jgi:uncharacterized membrane protein/nitrite reductase/ring-hydroxylating ferredoxin subunit